MFKRLLPVDFLGIIVDLPDVCVELIVELLGGGEGVVGILQLIVGNQIPFVRTVSGSDRKMEDASGPILSGDRNRHKVYLTFLLPRLSSRK